MYKMIYICIYLANTKDANVSEARDILFNRNWQLELPRKRTSGAHYERKAEEQHHEDHSLKSMHRPSKKTRRNPRQ